MSRRLDMVIGRHVSKIFAEAVELIITGAQRTIGKLISVLDRRNFVSLLVGVYAEGHPTIFKLIGVLGVVPEDWKASLTNKRIAELKAREQPHNNSGPLLIVSKLLEDHRREAIKATAHDVFMAARSNLSAGNDTLSTALSSVLLSDRNPQLSASSPVRD